MSDTDSNCPLCNAADAARGRSSSFLMRYECAHCGQFEFETRLTSMDRFREVERHLIAGHVREQNLKFTADRIPEFRTLADLWQCAQICPRRIPDKARRLLRQIEHRSPFFGSSANLISDADDVWAYARNPKECEAIVAFLRDNSWIRINAQILGARTVFDVSITAAGLAELDHANKTGADFTVGFVAMSFDKSMEPAYFEAIHPAIEAAGWKSERADLVQFNTDVVDKFKTMIRGSRFVISECTMHRTGVYYEAGFAEGIGREVIWCCRADEIGAAHFDTNHLSHVVWETPADLREKMFNRIVGTIGYGPFKPQA